MLTYDTRRTRGCCGTFAAQGAAHEVSGKVLSFTECFPAYFVRGSLGGCAKSVGIFHIAGTDLFAGRRCRRLGCRRLGHIPANAPLGLANTMKAHRFETLFHIGHVTRAVKDADVLLSGINRLLQYLQRLFVPLGNDDRSVWPGHAGHLIFDIAETLGEKKLELAGPIRTAAPPANR